MKFKITTFLFLFSIIIIQAQKNRNNKNQPFFNSTSQQMQIVSPLSGRDLIPVNLTPRIPKNNRWLNYPTNFNALPNGKDPLLNNQKSQSMIPGNSPIENFMGAAENIHTGAGVPDSTGAVGPNHYIHSYNSGFVIFDKHGTILVPHNSLANIFPGEEDGDPIVLYDRYADRFLITEFSGSPNAFLMAVSLGPDPVNDGWATYRFNLDAFPDYPKFSIWHDGYYITANKDSGNVVYVTERDAMITANTTANIIGFNLPGVTVNANTVFAPLAMNSVGPNLPNTNTPEYITYLQDDAWGGITTDHLKIWEVTVDWLNTTNSTISNPIELATTPFDSFVASFGSGEVPQPGTSQRIDGITGIVSYMCNYWAFDDHNSVTLNFNIDVNGDNTRLGIRWYELRDNSGIWNIEQEGTFAPNDNVYRFMGSMSMDVLGNIGMAYSRGNNTDFTSLYYTGRFANDPLGQMTIDEELIFQGQGANTFHNRYGDYAQLTLDPVDNKTFWFTSEYFNANNNWETRVASFKIAPNTTNDVGVVNIVSPNDATLTNSESIMVTILNFGENVQSNFPISYSVNGTLVATETFTGTIASSSTADYTFSIPSDFSIEGQTYTISSTTSLVNDEDTNNDPFSKEVTHLTPNDIGVIQIVAPISGSGLVNNEIITVSIENFGGQDQTNFDVSYTLDGNATVTETVNQLLAVSNTINYSFTALADFSTLGTYKLSATTSLNNDSDVSNDEITVTIQKTACIPDATFGCGVDGIKQFILGTINVDDGGDGCNTENTSGETGYADRTSLSTDLDRSIALTTVSVQQNWSGGNNGAEQFSMWIDFNDNGVFETTEQLIIAQIFSNDNVLVDFDFPIPTDAVLGSHILRARVVDTSTSPGDPNDPCADYGYGETQDYTVNIIDSTVVSIEDSFIDNTDMTIISLENNVFQVELPTTSINEGFVITLHNMLGQKFVKNRVENKNGSYSYTLKLDGLSAGIYLVRLGNTKFGKVKRIIVK